MSAAGGPDLAAVGAVPGAATGAAAGAATGAVPAAAGSATTALLARLLEATPLPPVDAELDELLAAFEAVHAARQVLLDRLEAPLAPTAADRDLAARIVARQDAWRAALDAAHARVCEQRLAVGKLRRYAPVP